VSCFCVALFGLELTVGVSWAVAIDIGAEFSGSVSAVMNTWGNIGAAVASALTGYIASRFAWSTAFAIPAGFSLAAALLSLRVDASRRISTVGTP
jgi:sugar phosphate permease